MGSIYKRGEVFWIKYYRNGKPYRESVKSDKETDAKRLLKHREGEISQGKIPGVYFDKIRFDDLAKDFLSDYRINERKSIIRAERSVNHLKRSFERCTVHRHHNTQDQSSHRNADCRRAEMPRSTGNWLP